MASLIKRGKYYSLVFKKHIKGKPIRKTYALGTKYKKIAEHKKTEYEQLYQRGKIDPFDDAWNLKEYEESRKTSDEPSYAGSYLIEEFKKEFLKTKSHTSAHNIKAYQSVIKLFKEHVGQTMPVNHIQPSDIRTFCLQDRYSNATQRNYLGYLRTFFNWMVKKEVIEENPCNDVHPPQKKDKIVEKTITEEELKMVFKTFRELQKEKRDAGYIKDFTHKQFWFKPIITTAFYTGMRRGSGP